MKHSYDVIAGIVAGLAILLIYYFSALAISEAILPKTYEYAFNLAIAVVGAFSGAWFAFRLQNEKARKDNDARNVTAANNAIFELSRWYNKLHAFKKQFIDQHRENSWRHLLIMPAAGITYGKPEIDYESLSFIFNSSNPNILSNIAFTEQNIASTVDVIIQRSKMHLEILQPAVEKIEMRLGPSFSPLEIEKEIGGRHTQVLKMLTDHLINGIDAAITELLENMKMLATESQSMYPSHVFIGMIDSHSGTTDSVK